MIKFVVFSDIHFNEWNYGAKTITDHEDPFVIGLNDRLAEQYLVAKQIVEFCQNNEVKDVFFCGDLFHKFGIVTAPVIEVAVRIMKMFKERDIKVRALVGNHDMYSKDGERHLLHCVSGYCQVIATPMYITQYEDIPLAFHPYTTNKEQLTDFLDKTPAGSLAFLHQGVANVPMASGYIVNEILTPSMVKSNIAFAFTGHYHAHRQVSSNLMVVGAPIQQSFGDVGESSGFVYYCAGEGIARVVIDSRKFWTIKSKEDLKNVRTGDFIKVIDNGVDLGIDNSDNKFSSFERTSAPKDVELFSVGNNPTVRNLIKLHGEMNNLDTNLIFKVIDSPQPLAVEEIIGSYEDPKA